MATPTKIKPTPKVEKSDFRKKMEASKLNFLKSIEKDLERHFEELRAENAKD